MTTDALNSKETIDKLLNQHSYNPVTLINALNAHTNELKLTNLQNLDFSYHLEYASMDMIGINYRSDAATY
jgi:hypothetical protein